MMDKKNNFVLLFDEKSEILRNKVYLFDKFYQTMNLLPYVKLCIINFNLPFFKVDNVYIFQVLVSCL